jgi:hypothetical protein
MIAGGFLLLVLTLLLAVVVRITTMPSYLANWLFWTSLPFGALPVVMILDLLGSPVGSRLDPALRRLLLLTPIALLLMIPVLVWPGTLFGWATGHGFSTPFGRAWMNRGAFIGRSVGYVVFWLLLAILFSRPPYPYRLGRRRGIAAIGLFLYALTATLASVDWAMTVEPDWFSGGFGLLFIASQASVAISAAVLLAGRGWRRNAPDPAVYLMLLAVSAWAFMHFTQFLIIWSGDQPADIGWYLHRTNVGSRVTIWIALFAGFVGPVLLLERTYRGRRFALPALAVAILCAQALAMLWLVTPSLRDHFTVTGMDVLTFCGIGALMAGAALWPGPVREPDPWPLPHG